ncbi:MAG: adenylate kinase [Candidatus Sumerlaeia bacterium]
MDKTFHIILLGPPGAGKGTQAQLIAERLKYYHISTGNILREAVAKQTALGLRAKKIMDSGALVPDEIVSAIVSEKLNAIHFVHKRWLFDGYPRNVAQAEFLNDLLAHYKIRRCMVLNLVVDPEQLVRRLSGRRTCAACGATFNIYFKPPVREGVCDVCGAERLVQRNDDREDVIRERFCVYEEKTRPLVAYYEQRGNLVHIAGDGAPTDVFQRICEWYERQR